MAIRYDKKLNTEITRVVNNFNSKVKRLEREKNNLLIPEKVSIKELKKSVTSRPELKRELAKLQRYSQRGIEKTIKTEGGLELSRYELEETIRESRRIKASLTRRINRVSNITPTVFGVKQSATYSQMGLEQLSNLKARRKTLQKDVRKLNKEQFKDLQKQLEINRQKEKYLTEVFKENYIDKMLFNLGYFIGYDEEKIKYIKDKLMQLDEKQFLKLFETEEGIRAIRDYYPEIHRVVGSGRAGNVKQMKLIKDDITSLYDELYKSIESITEDYKK